MKEITLSFIPYEKFSQLGKNKIIDLVLDKTRENNLVIVEGGLKPNEEMELIEKTMEEVNYKYKGIELCSISRRQLFENENIFDKIRNHIISFLGRRNGGITIIGPAKLVKEIKRHPDKISLLIE